MLRNRRIEGGTKKECLAQQKKKENEKKQASKAENVEWTNMGKTGTKPLKTSTVDDAFEML